MRSNTEQRLNEIWYQEQNPPWWLKGLVPFYRSANRLDRWWNMRRRPDDLGDVPIVVVGNLTAGGSGKTPLVIRMCQILRDAGRRPGVISRGYGRTGRGLRLVSPASDPEIVGDEPLLIARTAGVPVIVAADRCAAVRALMKKQVDVIISDDGLQHYRLPRNLEICVVDGARGFGNGRLIPAGPLRESLDRLTSVDHIIVNGETKNTPELPGAVPMTLIAGLLRSMDDGQSWRLSQFAGCKANAVAGIANPKRFFDLLRQARIKVVEHAFPDHHLFSPGDFEGMDPSLPILMTEKDAVKCRTLDLDNAWYLSVEAALPIEWEQQLVAQVANESAAEEQRT